MRSDHAPRPYLHPLRTPAGVLVTDVEPADHPWHHGLSFAVAHVNDTNFWGGPTFSADGTMPGYRDRADHGRVDEHANTLAWIDRHGVAVLTERRTVTLHTEVEELRVEWTTTLHANENVVLGSPSTEGRPGAGYGGLFWRGSSNFRQGDVFTANTRGEEDVNGSVAPWLAMRSAEGPPATVVLHADPAVEEPWFVRSAEYPGAGPALAFHHRLRIPAGGEVRRHYVFRAIDGHPRQFLSKSPR